MNPLDLNALEQLLDVYGAEPRRWPAAQRQAAQELIATELAARELFAAAQALEEQLAALPQPALPAALAQRILANAPQRSGWTQALRQLWSELGGLRLAGPVLACGLMAGITWPMLETPLSTSSDDPDLISVAQLGEEQWDISDLETAP